MYRKPEPRGVRGDFLVSRPTPAGRHARHCPGCGGRIVQVPPTERRVQDEARAHPCTTNRGGSRPVDKTWLSPKDPASTVYESSGGHGGSARLLGSSGVVRAEHSDIDDPPCWPWRRQPRRAPRRRPRVAVAGDCGCRRISAVPVCSWPRWSRRISTRSAHGIGHGHTRVFMDTIDNKAVIRSCRLPHRTPRIRSPRHARPPGIAVEPRVGCLSCHRIWHTVAGPSVAAVDPIAAFATRLALCVEDAGANRRHDSSYRARLRHRTGGAGVLTWFGWTSCLTAVSCTVRSPCNASSATRFLKSAVNRRRRLVAIPVPPEGSGIHLNRLSEKAGPPHFLTAPNRRSNRTSDVRRTQHSAISSTAAPQPAQCPFSMRRFVRRSGTSMSY